MKSLNISVIGTGYVGAVTGACLADPGHQVIFVGRDQKKLDRIKSGKSPIFEPGLDQLLQRNRERITTTDGIIQGKEYDDNLILLNDIVEKPKPEAAPSHFGSIGRYVFTPALFSCLKRTMPGAKGEIQLTDGIRLLLKQEDVYAYRYRGKRFDTGDKLGYRETIIDYALNNKAMRTPLSGFLTRMVK